MFMGTTSATPRAEVTAGVMRTPSPPGDKPVRLSEVLWGINWSEAFPFEIKPGIWAEVGSTDAVSAFAREHFGTIFGDSERGARFFLDAGVAKERYLQHVCDSFIVRDGDTAIGVVICNPVDWSSYYLRMAAFLPAYQGQDLVKFVVPRTWAVLARAGVARFEMDTAPSNTRALGAALATGFVVTGTSLSERWGALSRLTRYLDSGAEEAYLDRFCASGRLHRDGRQNRMGPHVVSQRM